MCSNELCLRMMIFSSSKVFFVLIVSFCVAEGTLAPGGTVSVDCGTAKAFTCDAPGVSIGWNIAGLNGINIPGPFLVRNAAMGNSRITSTDTGGNSQLGMSVVTISGFSISDNGGIIQCVNMNNNNTKGMATISVGLRAPANVVAKAESCNYNTVILWWTQPSGPDDITTSVSCTLPSPACTECTTSPCTITGLNPSTEYEFAVTLNSAMCGTSMNTAGIGTRDIHAPANVVATVRSCGTITLQWDQPRQPNDVTTSVSCTPPSPGCAKCTTSPCTITGPNPSTEYVFTVTLNSGGCRASMNSTVVRTKDASSCIASNSTNNVDSPPDTPVGTSSTPLVALAVLLLLIPLIYPLGVLIAKFCCFRDKSYCEVFWCCGCCRKDKSPRRNSTELIKSPHPREEGQHQNVNKGEHIRFVIDGEENKDEIGNKQEHVVTYETVEQLRDNDGDVITDENVEQQGYEDWITYATLDFSGHGKGNINEVHSITDDVTYAAV